MFVEIVITLPLLGMLFGNMSESRLIFTLLLLIKKY